MVGEIAITILRLQNLQFSGIFRFSTNTGKNLCLEY